MFSANRVSIVRHISASFQFPRSSHFDFEFRQNCGNFHQILRHFGKLEAKNSIQQKRTINMANLYEGRIIPQIQMGQIDEQPRIGHYSNEFKLNGKEAFKSKSNFDLIRGLFVFRCCQFDWLVQNNQQILNGMQKILGTQLFNRLLKMTFYGHFVAGETLDEVSKTVSKLQQFGVQSILDYSVEQDIGQSKSKNEKEEFDKNVEIFCQCIDSTAKATSGKGFTVLKLTALGPPELLIRLTEIIEERKELFKILAGEDGQIQGNNLQKQLQNIGIKIDKAKMQKLLEQIEMHENGIFDSLGWDNSFGFDIGNVTNSNNIFHEIEVMNTKTGKLALVQKLTEKEQKECVEMNDRLIQIAEYAKEKEVRLMIDAEQTYFQPAISQFAISLMKRFNKENVQIVNTYQAYLRYGLSNLLADMHLARRENFHFGCKLVRGAYMEQERKMTAQNGQMDPINGTYEETTKMYHQCLEAILDEWEVRGRNKVSAMVASHNLETIKFAMELMRQKGIQPGENVLSFGQLYGMSDAISFTQAKFGYNIFKYIPWGPVQGVLPYLSRRALENGAMLQKVGEERQLLWEELKRRIGNWEWTHRPTMKIEGGKIEPRRPMKIAPQIVN